MTITFFEYGNSITFNTHDMPHDLALWEEGISAGDGVDGALIGREQGDVAAVQ